MKNDDNRQKINSELLDTIFKDITLAKSEKEMITGGGLGDFDLTGSCTDPSINPDNGFSGDSFTETNRWCVGTKCIHKCFASTCAFQTSMWV